MRNCPSCNHVILEDDSIFCNKCGEELIQPNVREEEKVKEFCPDCGTNIDSTAKFCKGCGVSLQGPHQTHIPPSSGSVNYFQKYKKGILGAAIVLIIVIAAMMINSAGSPLKKMEGYWYTNKYDNFMKIEPKGGNIVDITFYDDWDDEDTLQGKVLTHTRKSVEMSFQEDGETMIATLVLNDKSHLLLSIKDEDGLLEHSILLEKKTKSDFEKHYSED